MYIFQIEKSKDSTNEEFESAIKCAKNCIVSTLDNEDLKITIVDSNILIESHNQKKPIEMPLSECRAKIKNCFGDSNGTVYDEFSKITPIQL